MPDTLERPVTQEKSDRAGFRLAAFGAVLVVVLFAAYGIGRLNDSTGTATTPPGPANADMPGMAATPTGATLPGMAVDENQPHAHSTQASMTRAGESVGGLSLSSSGLTLATESPQGTTFRAGRPQPLRFKITNANGVPITTFAVVHDRPLHLVVIRRDLTGFQHLHPIMAPDGTWGIELTLATPGSYRAIADFTAIVGGSQVAGTLGVDLTVPGNYAPVALPAPAQQASADDFQVSYEGAPRVESIQPLLMTVTAAGKPAALEPYLGAYGHLVVLREGDVGYLHVHPETQLIDGKVKFWLAAPGPGRYRMFFDFQVAGRVHTAAWSLTVS